MKTEVKFRIRKTACLANFLKSLSLFAISLSVKMQKLLVIKPTCTVETIHDMVCVFSIPCLALYSQVDAVRRLVIRDLPKVLVIQLKRFDYDWER